MMSKMEITIPLGLVLAPSPAAGDKTECQNGWCDEVVKWENGMT